MEDRTAWDFDAAAAEGTPFPLTRATYFIGEKFLGKPTPTPAPVPVAGPKRAAAKPKAKAVAAPQKIVKVMTAAATDPSEVLNCCIGGEAANNVIINCGRGGGDKKMKGQKCNKDIAHLLR